MRNFKTQIRVKPLRSNDFNSSKYSLKKSLQHDTRKYEEFHIDSEKSDKNIFIGNTNFDEIKCKIEELKSEYGFVQKNTTIDVANYIFTVNKEFFDTQETKEKFLKNAEEFLKKECGENAVLSVIGHDDEDGFHVHAYAVPLHKTLIKNRYQSEEKIKINYRGKYSHSAEEIHAYRKLKKQDETKTGQLQTRWANFISKEFLELTRGEKSSEKKHITPKEYRQIIDEKIPFLNEEINSKIDENIFLENSKKELEMEIEKLRLEKYQIKYDLSIEEKQKVNDLRSIDIYKVAKIFGENSYPASVVDNGKKRKINNAIDYLVHYQKLSFSGSVKFLIDNFGEVNTAKLIAKMSKNVQEEIPNSIKVKRDLIKKEFEALGNPVVRITVQNPDDKRGINFGKINDEEERFFNVNQVIDMIEKMNFYNTDEQNFNIYITPIEYEGKHDKITILIDDIKREKGKEVVDYLGKPNLVLETSKDNFQMIYVMENKISYENNPKGNKKERQIYIDFFDELNKKFGDETISGLRHPFRLAGYSNKKQGRNNFFTKITYSNPNPDNKINAIFEEFKNRKTENLSEKNSEIHTRKMQNSSKQKM